MGEIQKRNARQRSSSNLVCLGASGRPPWGLIFVGPKANPICELMWADAPLQVWNKESLQFGSIHHGFVVQCGYFTHNVVEFHRKYSEVGLWIAVELIA